ncbi:MAG: hypothetical protein PHZ26_03145 [Candidatus Gracilibacteria bacterium]|nr:hypothetical protein [Candidatus Gracilibacteria bacterium]MDD2908724.1 hypothetical protein [Candidatus Gracilibacteria bacterium]
MIKYIFLTFEGYTYQPYSESAEPDVENVQMIGIGEGNSKSEAFEDLKEKNEWLIATTFNELYCYELKNTNIEYFNLKE